MTQIVTLIAHAFLKYKISFAKSTTINDMGVQVPFAASTKTGLKNTRSWTKQSKQHIFITQVDTLNLSNTAFPASFFLAELIILARFRMPFTFLTKS